jgi:hypothetical protein
LEPNSYDHAELLELRELRKNLKTVHALDTSHRAVLNRSSGKTHRTEDTCLPAVSMRDDNRVYIDEIPEVTSLCGFCRPKWEKEWATRPDVPRPKPTGYTPSNVA